LTAVFPRCDYQQRQVCELSVSYSARQLRDRCSGLENGAALRVELITAFLRLQGVQFLQLRAAALFSAWSCCNTDIQRAKRSLTKSKVVPVLN